jgi:hypothetical protein
MIWGVAAIKRYLEARLETARASGGEGLIAELVRVEKEGARPAGCCRAAPLVAEVSLPRKIKQNNAGFNVCLRPRPPS